MDRRRLAFPVLAKPVAHSPAAQVPAASPRAEAVAKPMCPPFTQWIFALGGGRSSRSAHPRWSPDGPRLARPVAVIRARGVAGAQGLRVRRGSRSHTRRTRGLTV